MRIVLPTNIIFYKVERIISRNPFKAQMVRLFAPPPTAYLIGLREESKKLFVKKNTIVFETNGFISSLFRAISNKRDTNVHDKSMISN